MDLLNRIFDGSLMPHGHCLLWRSDLLFLHVAGDILTALAYFAIPAALVYLVRKRDDLAFNGIFLLFAAFILFCGITHIISLLNIWHGYYFLEGVAKLATGLVSLLTAVMTWRLLPRAIAMPGATQLMLKNRLLAQAREQLETANQQLEARVAERTRELKQLAITDSLTGINNRREIMSFLSNEIERARRYSLTLCAMIIDLDHFKAINDTHGHLSGDQVLVDAARTLRTMCRASDSLGRYGGEEFLIILPNTSKGEAEALAERICKAISSNPVKTIGGETIHYSCSIGLTEFLNEQTMQDLLHTADNALYRAKLDGRDRVVVS